jgi:hypothetical protein
LIAGVVTALIAQGSAQAAVGQPRTDGPNYDRNSTVVQDGALTYLFFARSEDPCNRLASPVACNPDNQQYDMYVKVSPNGGKDYGPPQLVATNPDGPGPFYGRTLAATVSNGTIYVFWASGGNLQQLYYVEEIGPGTFSAPQPVNGADFVFNVEAVSVGAQIFLYTEEYPMLSTVYGVYSRSFVGDVADAPILVAADRSIPKAIVDNNGGFRMTYVDTSGYPTVNVLVASSADGRNFVENPVPVVSEPGVSNWDPSLGQKPNGQYYLFFAPDNQQGAGRQRIALTKSNDFVNWTAPHEISPGFSGGVEYWDYWPEPFVYNNKLTLYYTSERGWNQTPDGTGHIWTVPGQDGSDF